MIRSKLLSVCHPRGLWAAWPVPGASADGSDGPETPRFRPAMDPQAAGVLIMAIILSAYVVYLLYIRDGF